MSKAQILQELTGNPDTSVAAFDGDELIYTIGFACEERLVELENNEAKAHFKNKTQMKKFFKDLVDLDATGLEWKEVQKAEPVQNALSTVKRTITKVCKKLEVSNYEIYIGGENNFREKLPLPKPYKDRGDTLKPVLFKEIKEYLIKYHDAKLVNGREADDVITSRMWDGFKSKTKIYGVTQDKDARMASGWLFNHRVENSEPELIGSGLGSVYLKDKTLKGTGRKFLYAQILIGDPVDTYNPRDLVEVITGKKPRYGDTMCFNVLDPCNTDKECLELIVKTYKKWLGDEPFEYTDCHGDTHTITYIDAIQLYCDCAFMQRWEGDRVDIRNLINKLGVET